MTAYNAFLKVCERRGFKGGIHRDIGTRLVNATDNSIYYQYPRAVLQPKDKDDIQLCLTLAQLDEYREIHISARGGGTGTNGQSLNTGLIMDSSRHMDKILDFDEQTGHLSVQAGVVLDDINDFLRPYGRFFAPTVAPSDRATIGGMISTDASGKGSRLYGKTSQHIHCLKGLLSDGTDITVSALDGISWQAECGRQDRVGMIYRQVDECCKTHRQLIYTSFPESTRFLTGYNLKHIECPDGHQSLIPLFAGSEGTLAIIYEATLSTLPLPNFKGLFVVGCHTIEEAVDLSRSVIEANPSAIEVADETLMRFAMTDPLFEALDKEVQSLFETPCTMLLIECEALDAITFNKRRQALLDQLEISNLQAYVYIDNANMMARCWALRSKGLGLLSKSPGREKPTPFIEDTVVPLDHLSDYLKDMKTLLHDHDLSYGMYGHIDVGCIHVRPMLDMAKASDQQKIKPISDQVLALVRRYKGIFWGEHGKGFRADYATHYFPAEILDAFRDIKRVCDPHYQLNPGKIIGTKEVPTYPIDQNFLGTIHSEIHSEFQKNFQSVLSCNGNGRCFSQAKEAAMCPSYKATKDRVHSPKGRAALLREWCRQESQKKRAIWRQWITHIPVLRQWFKTTIDQAVYEAMQGCLSCKACVTQCPMEVNIPDYKTKFLRTFNRRYGASIRSWLIASQETSVRLQSCFPRMSNTLMSSWPVRVILNRVGLTETPRLSTVRLTHWLKHYPNAQFDRDYCQKMGSEQRQKTVFLVQDAFTVFYDVTVFTDTFMLLKRLGFQVIVLPFIPHGKGVHSVGFLSKFKTIVAAQYTFFESLKDLGIPVVCLEPSIGLLYRDEYPAVMEKQFPINVQLIQEWLASHLSLFQTYKEKLSEQEQSFELVSHCIEAASLAHSGALWQSVFQAAGLTLTEKKASCCGLAGVYGYEIDHVDSSKQLYNDWYEQTDMQQTKTKRLLTGYSCRCQVKRFSGFQPKHPIQALLKALNRGGL